MKYSAPQVILDLAKQAGIREPIGLIKFELINALISETTAYGDQA